MYRVLILPLAKNDIREAARWYESRQIGLGKRFSLQVREKMNLIEKMPESFNIKYANIRTAVLTTFPFLIHYCIDDNRKLIIISAVYHTSRNPKIWGKK